jgi:hypothetical protein
MLNIICYSTTADRILIQTTSNLYLFENSFNEDYFDYKLIRSSKQTFLKVEFLSNDLFFGFQIQQISLCSSEREFFN